METEDISHERGLVGLCKSVESLFSLPDNKAAYVQLKLNQQINRFKI